MSPHHLLASQLPGVLDGWCGPALHLRSDDHLPPRAVVVVGTPPRPQPGSTVDYLTTDVARHAPQAGRTSHDRIALDLSRPEVRDRLARWVAEGLPCSTCLGSGKATGAPGTCPACGGDGWPVQAPTDLRWAVDVPRALRWAVLRLAQGLPVLGCLGSWRWTQRDGAMGWERSGPTRSMARPTTHTGREAADRASAEAGWWLTGGPYLASVQRHRCDSCDAVLWPDRLCSHHHRPAP